MVLKLKESNKLIILNTMDMDIDEEIVDPVITVDGKIKFDGGDMFWIYLL